MAESETVGTFKKHHGSRRQFSVAANIAHDNTAHDAHSEEHDHDALDQSQDHPEKKTSE